MLQSSNAAVQMLACAARFTQSKPQVPHLKSSKVQMLPCKCLHVQLDSHNRDHKFRILDAPKFKCCRANVCVCSSIYTIKTTSSAS
ncbi:hypothetical protein DUNSADRAFT_8980 [Dunaliella salina]|uniref:Encoded protein n=1 Tax=Dunaliella salina TaxID=3046 RepID=A0ABQ7GIB9_DUNSA|nr:hypothetical protein DUNSADRAFT_8980 [Dunaliella salina]|eukprot:KAF5834357.1 hypothetical protein DUNSADRAFT_8980 [Dunaliella salina]